MKGLVLLSLTIFVALYLNLISGEDVSAKGLLNGVIGGQQFRACHCKCGVSGDRPNRLRPRLIGGTNVDPHSLPWIVIVLVKGLFVAIGALVSDRHIVTAASPLISATRADVKVTLGAHDRCILDDSGNFSISAINLHPNFDVLTRAHDLALLQLSAFVSFDRRVAPICLPSLLPHYIGQHVTVAGWDNFNTTTCQLRSLKLPVLTASECARSVTTSALLTPDKGCIGLFGSKSVICATDVGAPVQFQLHGGHYELLGIIPNSNVCDVVNSTVFVRIDDHLSWIKQHIRGDCSCFKI